MMKIAYDFHGVIETYPGIFKPMLETLNQQHELFIISGPPIQQLKRELEATGYYMGIHYQEAISVVDWLKEQQVPMDQYADGSWYCDKHIWWGSKAAICEAYEIDVLYDDKLEYGKHIKGDKPLFLHLR